MYKEYGTNDKRLTLKMKYRRYFHGLLIILISLNSFGQEPDKELKTNINTGFTYSNMIGKGIVNSSWINGYPPDCYTNYSASNDYITGLSFGVGILKDINKSFSYCFGLDYEEKGCKIPITHFSYLIESGGFHELVQQETNMKSNIRLKYLVIPAKMEGIHLLTLVLCLEPASEFIFPGRTLLK
jgi:hypothetical protein